MSDSWPEEVAALRGQGELAFDPDALEDTRRDAPGLNHRVPGHRPGHRAQCVAKLRDGCEFQPAGDALLQMGLDANLLVEVMRQARARG